MNTQINTKLILVGLISFILGAGIMHFSGRGYMDHGNKGARGNSMSEMKMGKMEHTMPGGIVMENSDMIKGSVVSDMGQMSMNDMAAMMRGKTGRELEKEFLAGMVPHHQGAVDMAKTVLADKTTSPKIRTFAENIIKAQDTEILQMKKWLAEYK
jgi:uncharacterized protein (DUF305 family)